MLPPPPRSWHQRISADRWFSIVAILASLAAAGFTGWYGWDTHGMRLDAQEAGKKQAQDVKLAREAAEKSAGAAVALAEAMKSSAAAAQESAQAGLASLELNRRALILGNLPSMSIFSTRLMKPLAAGEAPVVTTKLYNAGKGIAYELVALQWITFAPSRVFKYASTLPILPSARDSAPGTGNISEMTVKLPAPLTAESLKLIDTGYLFLYEFGRATYYDDTLERRRKHTWYWCNYYYPYDDGSDKLLLRACPEHNYTTIE